MLGGMGSVGLQCSGGCKTAWPAAAETAGEVAAVWAASAAGPASEAATGFRWPRQGQRQASGSCYA